MNLTTASYFSATLSVALSIVTLVFLIWLYRYTRVKPVLYNLIWLIVSTTWFPASRLLGARSLILRPGNMPAMNMYVFAAQTLATVISTLFFIWMLLALAHWGRANSSASRRISD